MRGKRGLEKVMWKPEENPGDQQNPSPFVWQKIKSFYNAPNHINVLMMIWKLLKITHVKKA